MVAKIILFAVCYVLIGALTTFALSLWDKEDDDVIKEGVIWPVTWLGIAVFAIAILAVLPFGFATECADSVRELYQKRKNGKH